MAAEGRRRRALWTLLASALAAFCGYLIAQGELADVDRVEVEGAKRTGYEAVQEAAGIRLGEPLIGLDISAARERVADLPWVGEVYSQRHVDGTVSLLVTERSPSASLAVPGGWAMVDADGRVLDVAAEPTEGLLRIGGLNIARATPGSWLTADQREVLAISEALREPVRSLVGALELTPEGYVLHLRIPGTVLLGDSDSIEAKLLALQTFSEHVDLHCLERLDLTSPETPVLTRANPCR